MTFSRSAARVLVQVLALGGLLAGGVPAPAGALLPGAAAPDFELPGRDQQRVSLAALKGKVVLLHFWASWCPACQQLFPWLDGLQARYGRQGLQVVGVAVDARLADAQAFLLEHPASFLVAFDSADRVPRSYEVAQMPTLVLIDAQGMVRQVHAGLGKAEWPALEQSVRAALGGH